MPKPKPEPEPVKEISEENRKLAEEFERALDTKLAEMDDEDTIDVIPVAHGVWTGAETGCFSVEIPLEAEVGQVTQEDITMNLKGRILTILIQTRDSDVTREIGKMLTLPENVDETKISTSITKEGNLKIQAPLSGDSAESTPVPNPAQSPLKPTATLALELHNEKRGKHGVGPVVLNSELCKLAETYAKAVTTGTTVRFDESNLGVNVFDSTGTDELEIVRQAVTSWYDQKKDYNRTDPTSSPKEAKQFYEIVWKTTGFLGVGVESKDGRVVVATLYCRNTKSMNETGHKDNVLPCAE